jgi:hypothetical protein
MLFSLLKTYINLLKRVLGLDHPHYQSLLSTLVGGKQQGTISQNVRINKPLQTLFLTMYPTPSALYASDYIISHSNPAGCKG